MQPDIISKKGIYMTYDIDKIEQQALEIIRRAPDIVFIQDLVSEMPVARSTFYKMELDKSDTIKDALELNRTNLKRRLRNKWLNSVNAQCQLALYRLLSNENELSRVRTSRGNEVAINSGAGISFQVVNFSGEN